MPSFSQILAQSVTDAGVKATVVYATAADLPLVGNTAGDIALVSETHRLYIFTGAGWYNVALINTNPTIITAPDGSYVFATDGTPIVITLQAQDPEEVPIVWSYAVTSGALGSTATVSQADNVFTITPSTDRNDTGEFSITFTASDGVNLATAASSFTLTFGAEDQYYNYSSLLLKSGSTAGLNNNTFVDESTNGFTVTSTGDVCQGSLSPYSPAGWSNYFDGSGDYLTGTSGWTLGSGDFCVELFVNPSTITGDYIGLLSLTAITLAKRFEIAIHGGTIQLYSYNGNWNNTSYAPQPNTWTHIAFTRSGSTLRMFANGAQQWSATVTEDYNGTYAVKMGYMVSYFKGYLSNIRVVTGSAVYSTGGFSTPTSALTAISGTQLLTCLSNRFIDSSSNAITLTVNGNSSVQPFSPYLSSEHYDPTVHGGSAYFDGSGDYLDIPGSAAAFGTSDYTVEGWHYYTGAAATNTRFLIDCRFGGGSNLLLFFENAIYKLYINGHVANGGTLVKDAWQHFALVRSSGSTKLYVNGTSVFTWADSTNYASTQIRLGRDVNNNDSLSWVGYMSDIRIVKGTAVYTSNFTPPTEPLTAISGTSLLVRGNNAGIYDEMSRSNFKIVGNTTTSTTQTKYNDTSVRFDGNGDYILCGENYLGSANFTAEMWWYPTSTARQALVHGSFGYDYSWGIDYSSTATNQKIGIWASSNGTGWNIANSDGGGNGIGSETITQNAWNHIALTRSGTTLRLFVNGVLDVEVTGFSGTIASKTTNIPIIGSWWNNIYYNSGYIEDFRITNGVARYTANFTPPTAALGFSNEE